MNAHIKKDTFLEDLWDSLTNNLDFPKDAIYDVYDLMLGKPIHLMQTDHEWPIFAIIAYELNSIKPSALEHFAYEIMVR